jgi:hypothetical protein
VRAAKSRPAANPSSELLPSPLTTMVACCASLSRLVSLAVTKISGAGDTKLVYVCTNVV